MHKRFILSPLILSAVLFVGLPTSVHGQVSSDKQKASGIYQPIVNLGAPDAKIRIKYIWAANDVSRNLYKTHIRPLIERGKRNNNILVSLIQISAGKGDGRGPGALLFCAETQKQYALAAIEYLSFPFDSTKRTYVGRPPYRYSADENTKRVFESNKIDGDQCVQQKRFSDQVAYFLAADLVSQIATKQKPAPIIYYDGRAITAKDRKELARIEQLGK